MPRLHFKYLPVMMALFFCISLSLLLEPSPAQAAVDADSFVTRSGTKFYLNGNEFKFVGFNMFDAAATDRYKCAWWPRFTDSELDSTLKYMRQTSGATVLRFWAFQTYTKSGQDWSGMDRVIRIAKQNGFKVLPVLDNGPASCTGNTSMEKWQYQNDSWYVTGYKVKFGTDALSYRDYVKAIVTKYKDEPTIFGWVMMNEANTGKRNSFGKTVLMDFTKDVGGLIKSIDTKHLVTVGTQSNGATAASGTDFVDVYSLSQVDFTSASERGYWVGKENDPLPGSADGKTLPSVSSYDCLKTYQSKVACSLANSIQVVKKPFVIMEAGVKVDNNPTSRQTRSQVMKNKMNAMFNNGASGYMLWHWNKLLDDQKYDILQSQSDPLMATMKTYAGYLPNISNPSTPGVAPAPITTGANAIVDRGVNLVGGWQSVYGGVDAFASPAQLSYFQSKGLNTFRVGFLWDRLQPTLYGPFDPTYLAKMDKLVLDAEARGQKLAFVPLPGKWKGNDVGTSAVPQAAFNDLWIKLATRYKNEPAIWGYNLINEPGMGDVWNISIAPSAIAAIRTVDMKKPIIVPTSTGGYGHYFNYHLIGLPMQDPANNLIYEAHFYFDTAPDGVYRNGFDVPNGNLNIGVDRARDFVDWCKGNNQKCYAGEYGIPAGWSWGTETCSYLGGNNKDARWLTVLDNFLTYMDQNNISGTYWASGPYGDVNSVGPFCDPVGKLIDGPQMPILLKHLSRTTAGVQVAMPNPDVLEQPTSTATNTPELLTATMTLFPTLTATNTPTETPTYLPSATPTLIASATITPTVIVPTATLVPSATKTPIVIPTVRVPTATPTYLPSATPALIPSATITETPTVMPTVRVPTATQQVVIIPTKPSVIIIGGGQATPVVNPPATQPSVIIIGGPVVSVPTQPSVIIIGGEQATPVVNPPATQPPVIIIGGPVVPTPTPVGVIVVPTAVSPVIPTAVPSTSSIVSFTLVNQETGADILTFTNGMSLDMAKVGAKKITIRANTQGTIGSVVFDWDSNLHFKTVNLVPYTLYDDTGHMNYSWPYTVGQHTLSATAYSSMGGSGTALGTLSVQFTLVKTSTN